MPPKSSGGGKHKHRARKFEHSDNRPQQIPTADRENCEHYAVVQKRQSGGAEVLCDDGSKMYCHIRGSFRFKKRGNVLTVGGGVLVRKRDYERRDLHCDLVRVYDSDEVARIPELNRLCAMANDEEGGVDYALPEVAAEIAATIDQQMAEPADVGDFDDI
jgi:translation initiation factor IF-1